jgi:hypothetical protein
MGGYPGTHHAAADDGDSLYGARQVTT